MANKYSMVGAAAGLLLLAVTAMPLHAADSGPAVPKTKTQTTWIYPVIPKFGAVHPRPDAAVQPDPNVDYKVFVDVVSTGDDHTKPMESLERLARLVNLMGFAKVPPEHVHIVALLDKMAGIAALTNGQYRKNFKVDNPNLDILHALKKAGVTLMVCSQALAGRGLKDSDVDPSVTVTLSGLTDPVVYGQRGYTFMQL